MIIYGTRDNNYTYIIFWKKISVLNRQIQYLYIYIVIGVYKYIIRIYRIKGRVLQKFCTYWQCIASWIIVKSAFLMWNILSHLRKRRPGVLAVSFLPGNCRVFIVFFLQKRQAIPVSNVLNVCAGIDRLCPTAEQCHLALHASV